MLENYFEAIKLLKDFNPIYDLQAKDNLFAVTFSKENLEKLSRKEKALIVRLSDLEGDKIDFLDFMDDFDLNDYPNLKGLILEENKEVWLHTMCFIPLETTEKVIESIVDPIIQENIDRLKFEDIDWTDVIDHFGYSTDLEQLDSDVEEVENRLNTLIDESSITYYSKAMDYLRDNDPSLNQSLGIAKECGYSLEGINSELLATLLFQQQEREKIIWDAETIMNEIIAELDI